MVLILRHPFFLQDHKDGLFNSLSEKPLAHYIVTALFHYTEFEDKNCPHINIPRIENLVKSVKVNESLNLTLPNNILTHDSQVSNQF